VADERDRLALLIELAYEPEQAGVHAQLVGPIAARDRPRRA
jgi:hypothetical protein